MYMKSIIQGNTAVFGSVSAVIAVFCFSINDVAIKFISNDYALHLVVLIRSLVGLTVLFLFIIPFSGGLPTLRTNRMMNKNKTVNPIRERIKTTK